MKSVDSVQWSPMLQLMLVALTLTLLPLSWWWLRQRGASVQGRLSTLTAMTLFLTFDLIVLGAFTRLTDSGLGCPDWPGCYGQASPIGALAEIGSAQTAMPSGPVTLAKAWIEMLHRYLAMSVGLLIVVAAVAGWLRRAELPHSPWWPSFTLAWVVMQGLFGKYTVTLKLYPLVVTLHLLGGVLLLALLVVQREAFLDRPLRALAAVVSRTLVGWVLLVILVQVALGGWVSSNYAVLACSGFPTCNGQWWPAMDAGQGFTLLRELGRAGHGGFLPFDALVAIHLAHRCFAVMAVLALACLAGALWRAGGPAARRCAAILGLLLLAQVLSGLSNIVFAWPIVAALGHSAGAAALVGVLTSLWARLPPERGSRPAASKDRLGQPA